MLIRGFRYYLAGIMGFLLGTMMMLAVDQCKWDDGKVETVYGIDEEGNCFARSMSNTLAYVPRAKCPIGKK